MSRSFSLRFRLTVWYAFALAVGLAVFAFAVWISMRHALHGDADRALIEDAQSLENFSNVELGEPGVHLSEEVAEYFHAYPRDTMLSIESRSGSLRFVSVEPFPFRVDATGGPLLETKSWYGQPYRVLKKTVRIGRETCDIVIASSLYGVERTLARLRLLLIALVPLIVITACVGGNWLSRRALKPVDEITNRARSIRLENLSERLAVPRTGDELQRLSETLNEMLSRLESAVRSLSRFTADASHEIRTPLSIIRATAEIAVRKPRSAESYREALSNVVAESERMTQLVDDLLFLARCDAESLEMPMTTVDLGATVRSVCAQMLPLAQANTIRLVCTGADAVTIRGNDLAVRRLLIVLLDNAVKYSNPGGLVSVTLKQEAERVSVEVADTGPGIAEEELKYIFDRFYRTTEARARVQSGSGLGLSLAAGIARRHDAIIEVDSKVGTGTRFRCSFRAEEHSATAGLEADRQVSGVPTFPDVGRPDSDRRNRLADAQLRSKQNPLFT